MADEITVEPSPEVAGTDDISCGQPLIHDDQPSMATHAAEPPSPATNMAANVEPQIRPTVSKGKSKIPKMNAMYSPMAAGVNYQIFNPFGYWPAQGQHIPMPPHPFASMAAGPSWATPPPVATNFYSGAAPPPFAPPPSATPPFAGLVPISHSIIFSLGKFIGNM